MDSTFLTGSAAFISAVIVFCGSVFLLMAFVMGARLAYWVTASVTLAFVLIMGGVWSYGTPLGPVGQLPAWSPVDLGADQAQLDFGPAGDYPEGDWFVPDPEDSAQATQASELESASSDYLETEIAEGGEAKESFATIDEAILEEESGRLIEVDGETYGAVTYVQIEPPDPSDETADPLEGSGDPIVVVMSYDPGNPSRPARMITAGTFLLLVGHLIGLSRAERRAKRDRERAEDA